MFFAEKIARKNCHYSRTAYGGAAASSEEGSGGRDETPGHKDSPGAKHSSKAKVPAQKLQKIVLHDCRPPFWIKPTTLVGLWVL